MASGCKAQSRGRNCVAYRTRPCNLKVVTPLSVGLSFLCEQTASKEDST